MTDIAKQQDSLYQQLTQSIQSRPGSTTPVLRKALFEYAKQADLSEALPPDLQVYVTKVCKHAYKVTDEDIERLQRAGYDEDAIFEITLSTALGTGTRCLMQGMMAIEGANNATKLH